MLPIEKALQELREFQPLGSGVLSVYLLTDPSTAPGRNVDAQFKDLLRELSSQLKNSPNALEQLSREAEVVGKLLASLRNPSRGLAVFSCSPHNLLQSVAIPVRAIPNAYWGDRPYLLPLLRALDEFERTIVVLLDKERARMFRVWLDQIEEVLSFEDPVPGKHEQGGWAQARYQRHHETHVLWHVRRAVDLLGQLAEIERVDRILLGGTPEPMAEFRRLLPRPLRERVATEVRVPVYARASEVLATVIEVQEATERAEEERLLDQTEEWIGTGQAVTGPANVLQAVLEQQVFLLVFGQRVQFDGSHCERCGLLALAPNLDLCPACGGQMHYIADLVERMAQRVLDQGGRVEEVRGPAAERLQQLGGIAALLRYPAPSAQEA